MLKRDPNEIYQRKSISQETTFDAKGISKEKVYPDKIRTAEVKHANNKIQILAMSLHSDP